MLSTNVLECLFFIDKEYGLYIFDDRKLLKARPYNVSSYDNTKVSGIEYNHPLYGDRPLNLYISVIREHYCLAGNVLFIKNISDEDKRLLSSFISLHEDRIIEFENGDYVSEDKLRNLNMGRNIYKANKTTNNSSNNKTTTDNSSNNKTTNNKEQNTMKNNFSDIINMKMMMSIINNKGEIDLTKLMVLQSFAKDGTIEVTDIIKTKLTEKILKDTKSTEDLPVEKLAFINMLDNGNLDLQEIIKYKMLSSDDVDMEKMMLMSCMTNGGDMTDIFKYKMMSQLLKETDAETK